VGNKEGISIMPDDVHKLIKDLDNDDRNVRRDTAYALRKIRDDRAVEALCQGLRDTDSGVRWKAAFALVKIGATQALCKALGDKDSDARSKAAYALGEIGDARAVKALCKALEDNDNYVRSNAAFALGKIGDQDALPRKILLCSAMDSRAKVSALDTLSAKGEYYLDGRFHRYKTPNARRYCQGMAGNADLEIRKAAEDMLRYLDNDLVVPAPRDYSRERDELLHPLVNRPDSALAENLLRGSEAPEVLPPKPPALLKRLWLPVAGKQKVKCKPDEQEGSK
jgi:hypothetical protein